MGKHYYPSRNIPKGKRTEVFKEIFGHRFLQIWFKKISGHGVAPVLIGAAVVASGYSEMYIRSVAVMVCAVWFSIDVGIWLAETKSKYKETIFCLCAGLICSLGMGIMYWFLDSTLRAQQEDVYQSLSARAELPAPGDVMSSFFIITNGGKTGINHSDNCGIHLIVGENRNAVGSLGVIQLTNGGPLGPSGEGQSIQCFNNIFGFVGTVACADVEIKVQYALETQPAIQKEKFFRFAGYRSANQFVFVPEPPSGKNGSKENDERYCGRYLATPRPRPAL
jgi:hypothetical protein